MRTMWPCSAWLLCGYVTSQPAWMRACGSSFDRLHWLKLCSWFICNKLAGFFFFYWKMVSLLVRYWVILVFLLELWSELLWASRFHCSCQDLNDARFSKPQSLKHWVTRSCLKTESEVILVCASLCVNKFTGQIKRFCWHAFRWSTVDVDRFLCTFRFIPCLPKDKHMFCTGRACG